MIQAAFFGVFDYVSKNTWAQVVAGLVVGYFALKVRDKIRDRRTAKRVERRIEKKSRRVQARIERDNDEKLEQAVIARDTVQRGIRTTGELSERQRSRLISD